MRLAVALCAVMAAGCSSRPAGPGVKAYDEGYRQGAADLAKNLYWQKQANEATRSGKPAGSVEYFLWSREDGSPPVQVPVFVPDPAPPSR